MSFSGKIPATRERLARDACAAVQGSGFRRTPTLDASITRLLWHTEFGAGGTLDASLLAASEIAKWERFGGAVFGIVPVYVTSICSERCTYCNFRSANRGVQLQRSRLTAEELRVEVEHLVSAKGLRVIELVYATDPMVRVDRMCRDVELVTRVLARHGGGAVGINAEALDESEYRSLGNAGLNFIVLWQETYDRERYVTYHPGQGKKSRFEYRADAPERMIAAGLRSFGMGILSGLADWRMDWAMLIEHESYLSRVYGIGATILGVPRLKPAAGALVQRTSMTPSRQEFRCAVALHSLFSPSTLPFLSTREEFELCRDMAAGGGTLFTFNCSTIPGGYAQGAPGYQFPTGSYDAPVFAPRLAQYGITPVFDWRFDGQSVSIREEWAVRSAEA